MPKPARKINIQGDIAIIPLTQGFETIIDAADVDLVCGSNWQVLISAHRKTPYATHFCTSADKYGKMITLHRFLMNPEIGYEVDHIDGDGLNNRRSNLRIATHAQNQHNVKKSRRNTSGFKGVSFLKSCGKWTAILTSNRKKYFLGQFETAELAHEAYIIGARRIHGEFSRID